MTDSNNKDSSIKEELSKIDEQLSKRTDGEVYSGIIEEHHHRHHSEHHSHHSSHHNKRSSSSKKKRKKHSLIRVLIIILLVIAIACGGTYYYLNSELNKINKNTGIDDSDDSGSWINDMLDDEDKYGVGDTENIELLSDKNITNILLLGQDRRSGDAKYLRSDVIMICSINKKTKEISLTSIMRDLYVPIYVSEDEVMYGPINYSLLRGGPNCICKTIERDFGITIDGYMLVDFFQFVDALDELGDGTLDIDLTQEEANYLNQNHGWISYQLGKENCAWNLVEGTNKMNSLQVLGYCRLRQIDNDFHRISRQQSTIQAVLKKLQSENISEVLQFIDNVLPNMYTDLTNKEIIKYASNILESGMKISNTYRIPIDGSYTQEIVNDKNYANGSDLHLIIPNIEKNAIAIQKYIYK